MNSSNTLVSSAFVFLYSILWTIKISDVVTTESSREEGHVENCSSSRNYKKHSQNKRRGFNVDLFEELLFI